MLNGIVGNLLGGLLGGGGQAASNGKAARLQNPFKSHLIVTQGDAAYDTEAEVLALVGAAGTWTKIWQRTVPAQMEYRFGFGSPAYPDNQGYLFFVILDEGTNFSIGEVRLVQNNSRESRPILVFEAPDTRLHGTTVTTSESATPTSRQDMMALPEKVEHPRVGEDSLLQIWYNLITAATTADAVAFAVPVTIWQ